MLSDSSLKRLHFKTRRVSVSQYLHQHSLLNIFMMAKVMLEIALKFYATYNVFVFLFCVVCLFCSLLSRAAQEETVWRNTEQVSILASLFSVVFTFSFTPQTFIGNLHCVKKKACSWLEVIVSPPRAYTAEERCQTSHYLIVRTEIPIIKL